MRHPVFFGAAGFALLALLNGSITPVGADQTPTAAITAATTTSTSNPPPASAPPKPASDSHADQIKAQQLWAAACAAWRRNNFDEVVSDATQALKLDPALPNARIYLALALSRTGHTQDAIDQMKQMLAADANNVAASRTLASLYLDQNNFAAALEVYHQLGRKSARTGDAANDARNLAAKASGLIRQGNYDMADKLFAAALEQDPTLYEAHAGRGFVLLKLNRKDEAVAELKESLSQHQDKVTMMNLAAVYQQQGKLADAMAVFQKVRSIYPKSAEADKAAMMQHVLGPEMQREQAVESELKSEPANKQENIADDYFAFATGTQITKWPASKMPLKVYIPSDQDCATIPHYHNEFGAALKEAFATWQSKSKGAVSFTFVDAAANADIECAWSSDPSALSSPAEGGEAKVTTGVDGIRHVQIHVLTENQKVGIGEVPLSQVKETCLHEIGHSLGISGHSPDPDDVMFHTACGTKDLTERDINTLLHLYRSDVVVAAVSHPLTSRDPRALNVYGLQLMDAGKLGDAAAVFKASLRFDPNSCPAKHNLSICLAKLGCKSLQAGRNDDACEEYDEALKEALASPEDKGLLNLIFTDYIIALKRSGRVIDATNLQSQMTDVLNIASAPDIVIVFPAESRQRSQKQDAGDGRPKWWLSDDFSNSGARHNQAATPPVTAGVSQNSGEPRASRNHSDFRINRDNQPPATHTPSWMDPQ